MGSGNKIKKDLLNILDERVHVCDGAMGTTLQKYDFKGPNDLLNLDPEALKVIEDIHFQYLEAGSDIIQSNTMGSSVIKLEQIGQLANIDKINKNGIDAAKLAVKKYILETGGTRKIYIAGDMGPTGKILEPYGDTKYSSVFDSYARQAEILINEGVDLIIIETMIDLNEALAAVKAVRKTDPDITIACTLSFLENGVTVMGNRAENFGALLIEAGCDIIGANCSVGSDAMIKITEKIRTANPQARLLIQPNAGLPSIVDGKTVFNETPEMMANSFSRILEYKPSIVGACCGSTPQHILKLAELVHNKA
jgi:Methionine synthase I (cobalamin-dependent), methyltransferase domain